MMFLLCALIATLVSASKTENERRRPLCGGLCIGIAGGIASGAASSAASKRRRRIGGGFVDDVCTKTMGIVRETGNFLKDLLTNEGEDNMGPLEQTVETVKEVCSEMSGTIPMMNQCTFYLTAAQQADPELLEGSWLNAFGDDKDQHHGCGRVVNAVNTFMSYVPWARRAELENGQEVFITADESTSAFRRLIGATASGVIGAGMYLAHVCKSFDESNNLIASESTIEWN